MEIVKPPTKFDTTNKISIFLAGSIEMGTAEEWQVQVQDALKDLDVLILNPRRDDWDSSWKQEKSNAPFREQVEWELKGQEHVDLILFYFDPASKAPITLMELGLFHEDAVVCCPEGFWRKGNVDVVCEYYMIEQVGTLEELIQYAKDYVSAALEFEAYFEKFE